jgi:hypothetical protein
MNRSRRAEPFSAFWTFWTGGRVVSPTQPGPPAGGGVPGDDVDVDADADADGFEDTWSAGANP